MIVKESAVSQKNNLMNKILLFLLGGCIIGSAITIFSAQNNNRNYTYYWEVFFWYVIFRKDYAKKEYNN